MEGARKKMPDASELKRRNVRLAERFRTSAAPRIREAVQMRAQLLRSGVAPRIIASVVAQRMQLDVSSVRHYFRLYATNPKAYDVPKADT